MFGPDVERPPKREEGPPEPDWTDKAAEIDDEDLAEAIAVAGRER